MVHRRSKWKHKLQSPRNHQPSGISPVKSVTEALHEPAFEFENENEDEYEADEPRMGRSLQNAQLSQVSRMFEISLQQTVMSSAMRDSTMVCLLGHNFGGPSSFVSVRLVLGEGLS
jgi:hypothetical protein